MKAFAHGLLTFAIGFSAQASDYRAKVNCLNEAGTISATALIGVTGRDGRISLMFGQAKGDILRLGLVGYQSASFDSDLRLMGFVSKERNFMLVVSEKSNDGGKHSAELRTGIDPQRAVLDGMNQPWAVRNDIAMTCSIEKLD